MTLTFENARRGLREVHASLGEEELVELLARHGEDEEEILAEYASVLAATRSPAARYLIQLILDDERCHHQVLTEIANAVAWGWSELSPEPAVPELPVGRPDRQLIATTERLLAAERADSKELRDLRRRFSEFADTTIWTLLIELMSLDTRKHIEILEFIRKHAEVPVGSQLGDHPMVAVEDPPGR